MTSAPPGPAPLVDLPQGEGQWAIIAREFRKRRLAVWSLRAIAVLALISICAPFLANDRPIAYRGWNANAYTEARKAAAALIGQLASPPLDSEGKPTPIDRAEVRAGALNRLAEMQSAVSGEQAATIEKLASELASPAADSDETLLRRMQSDVAGLTARQMTFTSRWRFPVCAQLHGLDVGFLTLALLLLLQWVAQWLPALRRRHLDPAYNRWRWGLTFGLPLLAAGLWWLTVPQQNDLTQYKRGVVAADNVDQLARAPVVYESVVWPLIPFGIDENDLDAKKRPPAWWPDQGRAKPQATVGAATNGLSNDVKHWLGTDNLGRDLAGRMIWGGRVSLAVGVVAVAIYVTIGVIVGAAAGYFRGSVDLVISRLIEVVICFPSFFLILAIVAFVGQSMFVIMVVIGLTSWTGVARLVRAEFLRLSEQEFVLAGRVLGYSPLRLIFRHVLPNALAPVLVSATFGVAGAILTESALSFLGLGITVPKPSWGGILSDGRDAIFSAEWIIVFPGLAIFLTITFYNLVGEAFRDAADPRLRGSR